MTGEALLAGALALAIFLGIRWLRDFSKRMNKFPAEDEVDPETRSSSSPRMPRSADV